MSPTFRAPLGALLLAALALLAAACDDTPATADSRVAPDAAAILDSQAGAEAAMGDQAVADQAVADAAGPDAVVALDLPSGCNATKIGFPQANPAAYELWELCFAAGDTATEALIKTIDSAAACNHSAGGSAAKCPAGTWRCMGALDRDPVTKAVTAAAWTRLCQLSVLPAVSKIAGGYYL